MADCGIDDDDDDDDVDVDEDDGGGDGGRDGGGVNDTAENTNIGAVDDETGMNSSVDCDANTKVDGDDSSTYPLLSWLEEKRSTILNVAEL